MNTGLEHLKSSPRPRRGRGTKGEGENTIATLTFLLSHVAGEEYQGNLYA